MLFCISLCMHFQIYGKASKNTSESLVYLSGVGGFMYGSVEFNYH